jgi:hypothetical protein
VVSQARGVVDSANAKNLIKMLDYCNGKCKINKSETPHPVNQEIFMNTGIMHVLFDLLRTNDQLQRVLASVFDMLAALANHFGPAQAMMFERIDALIACESDSSGWQNNMAMAVARVFVGNADTCKQVTIEQIDNMITLLSEQGEMAPSLPAALCGIAKLDLDGTIFHRNQVGSSLVTCRGYCAR